MDQMRARQTAWTLSKMGTVAVELPCPLTEVLPGITWGHVEELLSPAFWKYHASVQRRQSNYTLFRLGRTLAEDMAVCLLGGYGMPAELGLAAFDRLRQHELLDGLATSDQIEHLLELPFLVDGRLRRYRFPRQKAKYLASALSVLKESQIPDSAIDLRNFLTTLAGVGPKTASWIVRNHFASDEVAILDVHILRAGMHIGLFGYGSDPARNYYEMESAFLDFCLAIDEPASLVDAIMWDYMRRLGSLSRLPNSARN